MREVGIRSGMGSVPMRGPDLRRDEVPPYARRGFHECGSYAEQDAGGVAGSSGESLRGGCLIVVVGEWGREGMPHCGCW